MHNKGLEMLYEIWTKYTLSYLSSVETVFGNVAYLMFFMQIPWLWTLWGPRRSKWCIVFSAATQCLIGNYFEGICHTLALDRVQLSTGMFLHFESGIVKSFPPISNRKMVIWLCCVDVEFVLEGTDTIDSTLVGQSIMWEYKAGNLCKLAAYRIVY